VGLFLKKMLLIVDFSLENRYNYEGRAYVGLRAPRPDLCQRTGNWGL
jgi:hypothetical protein